MKTLSFQAVSMHLRCSFFFALLLGSLTAHSQAPAVSYGVGPQTYNTGTAITPISPTSTGVAAFGFSSSVTAVGSGYNFPHGVAVDAAGNVYVADQNNGLVKKIPAGGGSPVTVGSGFSKPDGVTVDAAGNLYVADAGTGKVTKIPASGGAAVVLASGFSTPVSMAVDSKGNVLVTTTGGNEGPYLNEILAGRAEPVGLLSAITSQGVALSSADSVYISTTDQNIVQKLKPGFGLQNVATGFNTPEGITLDNAGNLYVADWGHGTVKLVPANGDAITILGSGFLGPNSVAVDAKGNLYVTDDQTNSLSKISPVGGYFISPELPAGLSFNSHTGVISGTPTASSSGTTYTITAYNSSGNSSATVNITVNLTLPTLAYATPDGILKDSLMKIISPNSANVSALKYDIAVGYPRYPGTAIVANGLSTPGAIAVDSLGNLYFTESGTSNDIKKIPAGGGAPVVIGGTASTIAVDNAGNVYRGVSGGPGAGLYKIPANGSPEITISTSVTPGSIAVDTAGDIYIADVATESIKKFPAGGGSPVTLATGYQIDGDSGFEPRSIALDGLGNLYVYYIANGPILTAKISLTNGTITSDIKNAFTFITNGAGYLRRLNNQLLWQLPSIHTSYLNGYIAVSGVTMDDKGVYYTIGSPYQQNVGMILSATPSGGYFLNGLLPAGMVFNNTTGQIYGKPTTLSPATNYTVTAWNTYGSASSAINIKTITNLHDLLRSLSTNNGSLSQAFTPGNFNYTINVGPLADSILIKPTVLDSGATVTVNDVAVASGAFSVPVTLAVGSNTVNVTVTSADSSASQTYTLTIIRSPSHNAWLSGLLQTTKHLLSPTFYSFTYNYTAAVDYAVTTVAVRPILLDPTASITVNGTPVASDTWSADIPINVGPNTVLVVVTAADGVTQNTYTLTVTRQGSSDALLVGMRPSAGALSPAFSAYTYTYADNVSSSVSSVTITPTVHDHNATVTVNGATTVSGSASAPITLSVGDNIIPVMVTAQDGVTSQTYNLTVTRAAGGVHDALDNISLTGQSAGNGENLLVHQGVSPNGDVINDYLKIEGIENFPDNKLAIMNSNGQLVFEAKGYDNSTKVFDGHSSKTGRMQLPGTYYYTLDYVAKGVAVHKTGYIVLKY